MVLFMFDRYKSFTCARLQGHAKVLLFNYEVWIEENDWT